MIILTNLNTSVKIIAGNSVIVMVRITGGEINNEEGNTLLSTSTDINDNNNNKEIPKTRDVEVQTSPNTNETIEIEEKEEEQKEEPRGGISVQQLLCN
ncbi:unnamed protein product [Rhizophagus irregularis]|nr:unnamed protein product [Rhizophagus irregularis]